MAPRAARGLSAERPGVKQQSSFDRRDVIRAIAEAARDGASLDDVEAFADAFLGDDAVVTLAEPARHLRRKDVTRRRDGRLVSAIAASPMYSSLELLAVEQRVVEAVLASARANAGVAGFRSGGESNNELVKHIVGGVRWVAGDGDKSDCAVTG